MIVTKYDITIKHKGQVIKGCKNKPLEEADALYKEFTKKGYDIIVILKREVKQ